jgi:hypothetical protein
MTGKNVNPAENGTLPDRLARIEKLEAELLRKAAALFGKHNSVYKSDLFMLGALKRTFAQSRGFRDLISAQNFPCAAAIVRLQIDTAMRVNALRLVEDRDALCGAVLGGQRFNTLKDGAGKKMTDAYLREKLAEDHPWITKVYQQTSDFVHLSGRHFYSSIVSTDDSARIMRFLISAQDPPRPEEEYFEVIDTFFDVSKVAATLILGYFGARAVAHAEQETDHPG